MVNESGIQLILKLWNSGVEINRIAEITKISIDSIKMIVTAKKIATFIKGG